MTTRSPGPAVGGSAPTGMVRGEVAARPPPTGVRAATGGRRSPRRGSSRWVLLRPDPDPDPRRMRHRYPHHLPVKRIEETTAVENARDRRGQRRDASRAARSTAGLSKTSERSSVDEGTGDRFAVGRKSVQDRFARALDAWTRCHVHGAAVSAVFVPDRRGRMRRAGPRLTPPPPSPPVPSPRRPDRRPRRRPVRPCRRGGRG